MDLRQNLYNITESLPEEVVLVAVSKTKPPEMVKELLSAGHLDFGENKVQELVDKQQQLPGAIRWHMIGHLQTNKVKYIAPFVYLVHGVDSLKLLRVLNKEGKKNSRVINCLFQMHIATEDSKFGLDQGELEEILESVEYREMEHINIMGMMGMATFTDDFDAVRREFRNLRRIFEEVKADYYTGKSDFSILSMGMSNDYLIAIEEGSNMIRVGSLLFGPRDYT
ncbi:MAG: YggS family pyridoxal phosphate-dependent enzyme [Bacteroidales bacterium]